MVDWNLDTIVTPKLSPPVRKFRQPAKPKPRGPFGIRKSKPLVENSDQHFFHSGQKKNKLPAERHSVDFKLEYGEATIEVHKDSIKEKEKILVIDDLIATGGTAEAAAKLIELSGGSVAGFIFIINLFDLPGNELLKKKSYFTESLIEFPGH